MATYFLDYEGGSDAADGTTFANRWKTLQNGATAARIAPGDVIRIMGSPAPTSLGINATWTNKSATITLASALNALITNCDTAWTASANVTCSANTLTYRTATGSASAAIAAGFTTGKAARLDLGGTFDYSSYQGITFWIQANAAIAASTLSIRLCSDTVGDVTVDTLVIPAISQANQWVPVHINKGSALGASIQSIALYADADPGTVTVLLDNISTTKAVGDDCLTLQSLLGKNTAGEYWWAIRAINGTTLTIDSCPGMSSGGTSNGYYGTTESVTTYKRETIKTDLVAGATTAVQFLQENGSAGNLIQFLGGWDRTDMSTQTLETWFDGQSGNGEGIDSNAKTYNYLDNIFCVRYGRGFDFTGGLMEVGKIYGGHCLTSGIYLSNVLNGFTGNELHAWGCWTQGLETLNIADVAITLIKLTSSGSNTTSNAWNPPLSSGNINITTLEVYNPKWNGVFMSGENLAGFAIGTMIVDDCPQAGLLLGSSSLGRFQRFSIGTFTANGNGAGLNFSGASGDILFGDVTITNSTGYGINGGVLTSLSTGADITIQSLTTSGNTLGAIVIGSIAGKMRVLKSSMAESTKVSLSSGSYGAGYLSFRNFNGTAGDHRTWYGSGGSGDGQASVYSESSVRHTASGLAWKINVNSTTYVRQSLPFILPVAKVYLASGVAKTLKLWMRRTHTEITGTLRIRGGQLDGIANDVTDSIGAAADTWEEQSVTVTPSESGVVEVDVLVYGGATRSLYIDDFSVV